jgi:SAM-dependent methyltransferase
MYSDVVDLRDFYETRLGQVTRRLIRRRVRELWPDMSGLSLMGMGYAAPYLTPFRDEAERILSFMPAAQGVLHWPDNGANASALVDESELPLQNFSIDRVLLIHALECCEAVKPMLSEIWRVMAGGGRLMIVVPNRRGIWARLDRTPFGAGSPFTPNQIHRLLRDTAFTPLHVTSALFIPPTESRMILRAASAWESVGEKWLRRVSGVIIIEATKQLYAKTKPGTQKRRLAYNPAITIS